MVPARVLSRAVAITESGTAFSPGGLLKFYTRPLRSNRQATFGVSESIRVSRALCPHVKDPRQSDKSFPAGQVNARTSFTRHTDDGHQLLKTTTHSGSNTPWSRTEQGTRSEDSGPRVVNTSTLQGREVAVREGTGPVAPPESLQHVCHRHAPAAREPLTSYRSRVAQLSDQPGRARSRDKRQRSLPQSRHLGQQRMFSK